jgi:hypothetical protein
MQVIYDNALFRPQIVEVVKSTSQQQRRLSQMDPFLIVRNPNSILPEHFAGESNR